MAAPSQDQNSGRDLPEPRSASAQLAPWLYLGALLGSGWLLFMHPATRVLRAEQAAASWLLAWVFAGIVLGAVLWSLRLARPGRAVGQLSVVCPSSRFLGRCLRRAVAAGHGSTARPGQA
ncbi:conserved hypothetical protein [Xanthomonas campestris pv. raphani 756C]|nr:conserved hypothetical protein [Xanthomonas campestris pv. raphani 756C]